jgi:hypothetical protein
MTSGILLLVKAWPLPRLVLNTLQRWLLLLMPLFQPDDDPEDNILEVIDGHIHSGVKGFYEKYFCSKSWSLAAEKTIRAAGP